MPEDLTFELEVPPVPEFGSYREAVQYLALLSSSYQAYWSKLGSDLGEIISGVATCAYHPKLLEEAISTIHHVTLVLVAYLKGFEGIVAQLRLLSPEDDDKTH